MMHYDDILRLTVDEYVRFDKPDYNQFLTRVIGLDLEYVRDTLTWRKNSPKEPLVVLESLLDLLGVPGQTYEIKYGVFRRFLDEEELAYHEIAFNGISYLLMRTTDFEMAAMLLHTAEASRVQNILSVLRCADMKFLECQALLVARDIEETSADIKQQQQEQEQSTEREEDGSNNSNSGGSLAETV